MFGIYHRMRFRCALSGEWPSAALHFFSNFFFKNPARVENSS